MERMEKLGMVASVQPHASLNPEKDRAIIGDKLYERAYPYRSLIDAGVPLSFGSDVPGEETFSPLYGMQLAVDRDGRERITAEEALRAYTEGSAHAEFAEQWKGRLTPGMAADFVVLDRNPLSVNAAEIASIRVLMTVVNGRAVYGAGGGYEPYGRTIAESASALRSSASAGGGGKPGSQ
jgi:predicted amidohydrolase YtcJ